MSDDAAIVGRITEAQALLTDLGFGAAQSNVRSALTLLALCNLPPDKGWADATNPLRGITPLMSFMATHYGKTYAPNTRETVRRQTIHQFLAAGLIVANPDDPARPINSGKTVYRLSDAALTLIQQYGTGAWVTARDAYLAQRATTGDTPRLLPRVAVRLASGAQISLSAGLHNAVIRAVIEEFVPRFVPGATVLYIGDTDTKFAYVDNDGLVALGLTLDPHGKMPDVILHDTTDDWVILVEAVTSHGPITPLRRADLARLFGTSHAGLVFVTAFADRRAMTAYLSSLAWETEVWVADAPDHLIHFNGSRFLGPYESSP